MRLQLTPNFVKSLCWSKQIDEYALSLSLSFDDLDLPKVKKLCNCLEIFLHDLYESKVLIITISTGVLISPWPDQEGNKLQ
jgi:hypothetical protein